MDETMRSLAVRLALQAPDSPELQEISARALREIAATAQRIEKATRTLWALTAAAYPERGRIRTATAEIEALERDQQERFMQAVFEAAEVLLRRCEAPDA